MRWRFFECMNEATLRNTVCWASMGNHEGKSSNGGSPTVGWHLLLPAGRTLPKRGSITLSVGQAMTLEDQPNEREGWRMVAAKLEEQVRAWAEEAPKQARRQDAGSSADQNRSQPGLL